MIRKVKENFAQYRLLIENFSYLSILQVSNLLIFLFLTPYLFRVLGQEMYGLVVYGQTIAIYFSILVNFGFTATATRDVSINREDSEKTSVIISRVLTIKSAFFVISIITLTVLVATIPLLRKTPLIFFLSMLFCLSETLFPIWYFQGTERMKYIAVINIITRITSALMIFIFIKHPEDYFLVPVFLGAGTVSGAIIGLYIVFISHSHRYNFPSSHELVNTLKDNIPLFISNISSQIYVNANKLIVGSFLGMQDLAVYDIADKIVNLLKIPIQLIGQTLFPRISRDKDVGFVKKAMWFVLLFFVIVYLGVLVFSDPLIHLFSGKHFPEAILLLRILALALLPVCLSLFYAELLLIPFGKLRDYARMRMFSLFLYLSLTGMIIRFKMIGLYQLAAVIIIVEFFVLAYSWFLCRKNELV